MTEHTFITGILNAVRLILLIIYALLLTIIIGCIQQHSRFLYRTLQTSTSNEQKSARGRCPPYTQTTCPWRISSV